jgi:hypothetical protein
MDHAPHAEGIRAYCDAAESRYPDDIGTLEWISRLLLGIRDGALIARDGFGSRALSLPFLSLVLGWHVGWTGVRALPFRIRVLGAGGRLVFPLRRNFIDVVRCALHVRSRPDEQHR